MGNNQMALPKNALMLKKCGEKQVFLNAPIFQQFFFNSKKQVQLKGSELCMVAGDVSHTTFSPDHKWRSLYMETCKTIQGKYSRWHLIKAGVKQP